MNRNKVLNIDLICEYIAYTHYLEEFVPFIKCNTYSICNVIPLSEYFNTTNMKYETIIKSYPNFEIRTEYSYLVTIYIQNPRNSRDYIRRGKKYTVLFTG